MVSSHHTWGFPTEAIATIIDRTHTLIVYAYINYTDVFGVDHQAGYGRRYDPTRPSDNNLFIIPHHAYNYDRPRKEGEGHD